MCILIGSSEIGYGIHFFFNERNANIGNPLNFRVKNLTMDLSEIVHTNAKLKRKHDNQLGD